MAVLWTRCAAPVDGHGAISRQGADSEGDYHHLDVGSGGHDHRVTY